MNDLSGKEAKRDELLEALKAKTVRYSRVRDLLNDIEKEVRMIKDKFDALDYEIAMKNRTIVPSRKATVKKDVKEFTLDEIKTIAIKLGVEISIKEEGEK